MVVAPQNETLVGFWQYQLAYFAVQPSTGILAEGPRLDLQITILSATEETESDPPTFTVDINGQDKNSKGCNHFRVEDTVKFTLEIEDKIASEEELAQV